MQKQAFNFQLAKERIDLVDYLASLGYFYKKVCGQHYKYLSPLPERDEQTPSFTVDRSRQIWYDHGIGKGGDLVTFVELYYRCSKAEVRKKLMDYLSFHPQSGAIRQQPPRNLQHAQKKITFLDDKAISAPSLLDYAESRHIPFELINQYCREVDFLLNGRPNKAIGFKNDIGGWELRNARLKCACSPKWLTRISLPDGKSDHSLVEVRPAIAVFEGFFDFLSFLRIQKEQLLPLPEIEKFLILNGLAFFEKSKSFLDKHGDKLLFLDNGKGADGAIDKSKTWGNCYRDCRSVLGKEEDMSALLLSLKKKISSPILQTKMRL